MPSITFTIPNEKYEEYKSYFLMSYPNQTTDSESPMTDDQWIKHRIKLFVIGAYKKGKRMEYEQVEPVYDEDIVQ